MSKYLVSFSPHITSRATTRRIMLDVIIALMPALIAATLLYGLYTFCLAVLSVGSAVSFMLTGPATKITNLGALKIVLGAKHFLCTLLLQWYFHLQQGS